MILEGILALEDYIEEAEIVVPGFQYPLFAFVEGVPGLICFQMYEALEPHLSEYFNFQFLRDLAWQFFVGCETHFKYIDHSKGNIQKRLEKSYKDIDNFVVKTIQKYT